MVIATRQGAVVKTNQSMEVGKRYAAWASTLCTTTQQQLKEESRLLRINTTDSEIMISALPHSPFLLITVKTTQTAPAPSSDPQP